jgi:hypothetical protein
LGACNEVEQASDIAFMSFFGAQERRRASLNPVHSIPARSPNQCHAWQTRRHIGLGQSVPTTAADRSFCHTTRTVRAPLRNRQTILLMGRFALSSGKSLIHSQQLEPSLRLRELSCAWGHSSGVGGLRLALNCARRSGLPLPSIPLNGESRAEAGRGAVGVAKRPASAHWRTS